MRLARLAETTERLRATSKRTVKADALAELLANLSPTDVVPAIGFLLATPRQGSIGVGWGLVSKLDADGVNETAVHVDTKDGAASDLGAGEVRGVGGRPPPQDTPDVAGLDRLLSEIATLTGPGSEAARQHRLRRYLAVCDEKEQGFVRRVLVGDARQGALAGVMTDAVAKAAGVKRTAMRRGVMLQGNLGEAAHIALTGGPEAVEAIDLEVHRPIQPMLASTATDVARAIDTIGPASVEWKLDGARIQLHIDKDTDTEHDAQVSIFTRNLNDVTTRLPHVVAVAHSLPCRSAVLDGELLGFFGDGHAEEPQAFQDTMSAFGTDPTRSGDDTRPTTNLRPYFFDIMYLDGRSLIDTALVDRLAALHRLAPSYSVPQTFVETAQQAATVFDEAIAKGHEGVMVKAVGGGYEAGRRNKSWQKVKPVYTLDLVVLAAEWGHGRRHGWLSNLHLGALDPQTGQPVMVGKTFKGLTDELLAWQTEALQARKTRESDQTVWVTPDLVVEVALDGAQASTRYPGGVALRFARVRRYRPDKDPLSADTLDAVRALLPGV